MTATAPPALYLAGQLERVRGYQEDTNREHELARIGGGRQQHGATVA